MSFSIFSVVKAQLRPGRRQAGYDNEEDDDFEDVATTGSAKSKRKNDSAWKKGRKLLQPTPEWRPSSKNSSTPSRTISHPPLPGSSSIFQFNHFSVHEIPPPPEPLSIEWVAYLIRMDNYFDDDNCHFFHRHWLLFLRIPRDWRANPRMAKQSPNRVLTSREAS